MSILKHLIEISGDSFWMYICGALALIAISGKFLVAIPRSLVAVIDFLRSERAAWLLEKLKKMASLLAREFTQTVKYIRPKPGLKIQLNGAIVNSVFYYLFFGLLVLEWLVTLAFGAINSAHISGWKVMMLLAVATGIMVPFALYFGGLAMKEQAKANRIWVRCRTEGLRGYAALIATPTALIVVAFIVSALQQIGDS